MLEESPKTFLEKPNTVLKCYQKLHQNRIEILFTREAYNSPPSELEKLKQYTRQT